MFPHPQPHLLSRIYLMAACLARVGELSGQFGWIRMSKMDRMSEKENSHYRKAEEITGERRVSRT